MKKAVLAAIFIATLSAALQAQTPGTAFRTPELRDIAMYEINPKVFSASGDLRGITGRLDEVKTLGINVIWLMPIFPVGAEKAFGSFYCVKDYYGVNPALGTVEDLKELIARAHERGIAVIIDWVANHSSWDNPWMEHPDWYTRDKDGKIIHPAGTEWIDVADLNYGNPDMRRAMIDAMGYWVREVGVDGFRCDAADLVPFDFWKQALDELQGWGDKNLIFLAEGERSDHFRAGFQLDFSWRYLSAVKGVFTKGQGAGDMLAAALSEYSGVPAGGQKLRFISNHDESYEATPISLFGGKDAVMAASAITIFLQGCPLLYCGQEVGVNAPSLYRQGRPIRWTDNPDMLASYTALLRLFHSSGALREGNLLIEKDPDVAAFRKVLETDEALVLVNTRPRRISYAVPPALRGRWVESLGGRKIKLGRRLKLAPYQYLILGRAAE